MGQQIPFQTLDDVAEGLRRQDLKGRGTGVQPQPVARTVELGGERLSRLELKLLAGDCERDVHLYESYWAPMTEGRVTLRDGMGFLFRGGIGGVRLARRPFRRWLFGEFVEFRAPLWTVLWLLLSLSVVIAFIFLSLVIVIVSGAKVPLRDVSPWLTEVRFHDITTVFNIHVSAMAPFVLLMTWWGLTRQRLPGWLTLGAFAIAVLSTLGAAVTAVLVAYHHARGPGAGSFFERAGADVLLGLFPAWFSNVSWVLVIAATALVRWFLIQYRGRRRGVRAAAGGRSVPRVAKGHQELRVGHGQGRLRRDGVQRHRDRRASLGSVVAYDVLNRLLIDHRLNPDGVPEIAGRTRLFLTFGCPLDKTAFAFAAQGAGTEAREALVASFQPLITDEDARPRWVNIYSPWDIISGSLDYYDRRGSIESSCRGERRRSGRDNPAGGTRRVLA